jgi:hypothetical protein
MNMLFDDLLTQIRNENLNVYRASAQRLREDVGQEAEIAMNYRGRLIYELLQNADDAMSSETATTGIEFLLFDDALWVANSGRPLDEADVRGLCGISASSKSVRGARRRASIGHKGMGFKSVLEICDAPEVYSTTISFRFGPALALQAVRPLVEEKILPSNARAPVTRFPWPIEEASAVWRHLRERGMQTAFRFPWRSKMTEEQRDGVAQALIDLPVASLVFLKHLGLVTVSVQRHAKMHSFDWRVKRQKMSDSGLYDVPAFSGPGTYRVTMTLDTGNSETFLVAHDPDIQIDNHRGGLDEFAWEGIDVTEVSVAARLENGRPVALKPSWKKLHVFLPTGEPCPYDLLVSGAFASNLSRQEIRVEVEALNYNRFLLRNVARLVRNMLIPRLVSNGAQTVDILRVLDRGLTIGATCATATAQQLFLEVRTALSDLQFLTREEGESTTIAMCVVPPLVKSPVVGSGFRKLLDSDAAFEGRYFPAKDLCAYEIARVLVDHGAYELTPSDAASVLAHANPARSRIFTAGQVFVDPVLRVLEELWAVMDADSRQNLVSAVRREPLFPVGINNDDTAQRVSTQSANCFYPPQSLRGTVPLDGLCFLMQEICWGDLNRNERNQTLNRELAAWDALFDMKEFTFPTVMRASVLPALDLASSSESSATRQSLHTLERIAAICQLAGRTPKASDPLPYERLRTNRAIFNLSRLDVPCRGPTPGQFVWVPAYRAYLGSDWVAENSAEQVLTAGLEVNAKYLPSIDFLIGPDKLAGLLSQHRHLHDNSATEDADAGIDEVSLDEDEDAALQADERVRWLTFFQWLGVNQSLRPVHFHDVEDRASGWLKTADLQRPEGWIFRKVASDVWDRYVDRVRQLIVKEPGSQKTTTPYFYELHHLEHLDSFLSAAAVDSTAKLGKALYEHLARNWPTLERFSQAQIALVPFDSVPSMRKPQQAKPEELVQGGTNFWVTRLQSSPFCPTGHGPRYAHRIWLPTAEVERRFGQRGKDGSFLLPTLEVNTNVLTGKARGFAQALEIREELTPDTFTFEDARALLVRLRDRYADRFQASQDLRFELREVIRPAYRNLFEMLSGRGEKSPHLHAAVAPLLDTPLLAYDGKKGYQFFEDRQFYFIDRCETRDRLQSDGTIWSFVIETQPAARSPVVQLFGVRILEETLRWLPNPGDRAFGDEETEYLRGQIRNIAPYILARIGVDRTDERLSRLDAQRLRRFVDCLEPVTNLDLSCELDGQKLNLSNVRRDAFVASESEIPTQAFVVWGERAWPPDLQDTEALANALCEVFGARYFEPFLALIQTRNTEDRDRLLRRAGVAPDIEDKKLLFLGADSDVEPPNGDTNAPIEPKTTIAPAAQDVPANVLGDAGGESAVAGMRRSPIFSPDELEIDGDPILVLGSGDSPSTRGRRTLGSTNSQRNTNGHGGGGYGGHTDLEALDSLGMWIALSFERNRLRRSALSNAEILNYSDNRPQSDAAVFDVSSPAKIERASKLSERFRVAMLRLRENYGVSLEWPGFDVLTLDPRNPEVLDRLIELKSSGVESRVQDMSWNEWKTASASALRSRFYLYLVGNLRSDLEGARPFVRTIRNPFEQLTANVQVNNAVSRKVQLAVYLFKEAEQQYLSVIPRPSSAALQQETPPLK